MMTREKAVAVAQTQIGAAAQVPWTARRAASSAKRATKTEREVWPDGIENESTLITVW